MIQLESDILLRLRAQKRELEILESQLLGAGDSFNPQLLQKIKEKPTEIVCKDFIPLIKGAYNLICGAGGSGKSALALRDCLHFLRANPSSNALCVFGEDDIIEIKGRIKTFCLHLGISTQSIENRLFIISTDNNVDMRFVQQNDKLAVKNLALIDSFKSFIQKNNIQFVILDPLKKFHSVSENDNSSMDILVRDVFLEIASTLNIVMLVIHHLGKSKDMFATSRGASTITDTSRVAYKIGKIYIRDNKTKEIIEDETQKDKIKISAIKDNKNIFYKYGLNNTMGGKIVLFPQVQEYTYKS